MKKRNQMLSDNSYSFVLTIPATLLTFVFIIIPIIQSLIILQSLPGRFIYILDSYQEAGVNSIFTSSVSDCNWNEAVELFFICRLELGVVVHIHTFHDTDILIFS